MNSVARTLDISPKTVAKLMTDVGTICAEFHDSTVRDVKCRKIQMDEIWHFLYAKQKNVPTAKNAPSDAGDMWTWTAIDPESKLVVSYWVGGREYADAKQFLTDLESRLAYVVQVTSDGLPAYREAMGRVFGTEVDFAQLVKTFNNTERESDVLMQKRRIIGNPRISDISTSLVERQNLTMRMSMRRYTRKTNGFSKNMTSHMNMLNLYFVNYNFCREHSTIKVTPAMEVGLVDELYDIDFILDLLEEKEAEKPRERGLYRNGRRYRRLQRRAA